MGFNARSVDAELRSALLERFSPLGFKPLPGGRRLFYDTRELTIIAEVEKSRPSLDGTYRDVVLGYFRHGTRQPKSPAFNHSQVYAHVMRERDIGGRELYNIRKPFERQLLLREIDELSVPFVVEHDSWSSIYHGILDGSVPTLQVTFTTANPPALVRDAAEVAVASGNIKWLKECRELLRTSDWGGEGNEAAQMFLEELPSEIG